MSHEADAVITGMGAVSALGVGVDALRNGVFRGRTAVGPVHGFDVSELRSCLGAEVDDTQLAAVNRWRLHPDEERCELLAAVAATEAITDAGLAPAEPLACLFGIASGDMRGFERCLLDGEGLSPSRRRHLLLRPAAVVSAALCSTLELKTDSVETYQNACCAGASAIGGALDMIRGGDADVVLAGGVEVLSRGIMTGFSAIRALSPSGCRPFSADRDGTVLGEGAAFVVLESETHARERGGPVRARVRGFGRSHAAYHRTRADAAGAGAAACMQRALSDAGAAAASMDYICAHGTGTRANDEAELKAVASVLGAASSSTPISSNKGMLGHTVAASGALNVVVAMLAIEQQMVPPSPHLQSPMDGYAGWDFVTGASRSQVVDAVLCNAFAFGGNNASLVIGAP